MPLWCCALGPGHQLPESWGFCPVCSAPGRGRSLKEAAGLAEAAHGAARPVTRPAAEPKGCVPSAGRPLPLYLNQSGCSLCVRTKPGPGGPVCPRAGRTPCAQRPASLGGPLAGGHSGRTPWRFPARTCNQHVSSGKRDKREKSRNKVGKTPVWSLPVSGGGQGARGAGPGLGGGRQAGGGGVLCRQGGAVLCVVGCSATSLASTHQRTGRLQS